MLYIHVCTGVAQETYYLGSEPNDQGTEIHARGEGHLYSSHSASVPHPAPHPIGARGGFPVLNIIAYLTTKFNQVQRLRMHRPVYPLSHTSSWYGAKLSVRVNLKLAFRIFGFSEARLRAISSDSTGRRMCRSVLW